MGNEDQTSAVPTIETKPSVGLNAAPPEYRSDLPPIPRRLRALPIERGYPVPWFVARVDDHYDFRVIGSGKIAQAVREKRCWICGGTLGSYLAFAIGPMCAINRVSSEPPSHRECAEWSARACPFLTQRESERRTSNLPEICPASGLAIPRQPGVILLWITRSYQIVSDRMGGVLFRVGDPEETIWMREGRSATREEVLASIDSGLPILLQTAELDGPKAVAQLNQMKDEAFKLLPKAA